jgi:hypothetical protein
VLNSGRVLQIAAGKQWNINNEANATRESVVNGVVLGNGDGTVPLLSLGYMCASAWQTEELNPAGMKVCPVHLSRCMKCIGCRSDTSFLTKGDTMFRL